MSTNTSLWPAAVGVIGVVLGAVIAGSMSFLTGWQSRQWAQRAWLLDSRRDAYRDFLASLPAFRALTAEVVDALEARSAASVSMPQPDRDVSRMYLAMQPVIIQAMLVASGPVHAKLTSLLERELRDYSRDPSKSTAFALEDKIGSLSEHMRADLQTGRR